MLTRLSLAVCCIIFIVSLFLFSNDYRLPHAVLFLFVLRHITNVSCCFSSGNDDGRHWETNGKLVVPKMLVSWISFSGLVSLIDVRHQVAVWSLAFFLIISCAERAMRWRSCCVPRDYRRRDSFFFEILFVEWSSDRLHWIHPAAVASLLIIKSAFNRSQ